jgi:hypothetical protein
MGTAHRIKSHQLAPLAPYDDVEWSWFREPFGDRDNMRKRGAANPIRYVQS